MKNSDTVIIFICLLLLISGCLNSEEYSDSEQEIQENEEKMILVFSATAGYRHSSIEPAQEALKATAPQYGFGINISEDAGDFTSANLSRYSAVVFLNTSEDIFTDSQRTAFEDYIRDGGGFIGVHSATDTEYGWPWYNRLVGPGSTITPRFSRR
jgi:type 1 glutamine amidotransferase